MTSRIVCWAVAGAAFTCFNAAHAHHSMAMFDLQRSIWLKGTVVDYAPVNPHARITLEQKDTDGKIRRWVVEGPNTNRLERMHVDNTFLRPGDAIEVCGFPWRQEYAQPVMSAPGSPRPAMHIHMVVMPDGRMRLFGPYGKLDNCIRPNDSTQAWVDFLNADPLGQQAWCNGLKLTSVPSTAPKGFVETVNGSLANQCN